MCFMEIEINTNINLFFKTSYKKDLSVFQAHYLILRAEESKNRWDSQKNRNLTYYLYLF